MMSVLLLMAILARREEHLMPVPVWLCPCRRRDTTTERQLPGHDRNAAREHVAKIETARGHGHF